MNITEAILPDTKSSALGFIHFDGIGEKSCAEHNELNSSGLVHLY